MLNELLSEADLVKLSGGQRDFIVQRIDHALDNDPEIRKIIASKLEGTLRHLNVDMAVQRAPE